jgi:hypothetical protein
LALTSGTRLGVYEVTAHIGEGAAVMALVEGDRLSQRITRGAIPVDEVLPIQKGETLCVFQKGI